MTKLYEKNIEIIKKRLIGENINFEQVNKEFDLVEDIECVYVTQYHEKLMGVLKKNNQINDINSAKVQTIIIIGILGLKYLEKSLFKIAKESQVIIIEPNKDWIRLECSSSELEFVEKLDISICCCSNEELSFFLSPILTGIRLLKLGNRCIHINDVYEGKNETVEIIKAIRKTINDKMYSLGNSIEDSLIGVEQNLRNLRYLKDSKSVSELKDKFKGIPAIVVSAGPSLNKNIALLKSVKNKYLIIAVDTIVKRLLNEGITPDFICSVERVEEVYTYFYKEKEYPKEITLVGPPLLNSEIFESFKGEKILPLRAGVGEYRWLKEVLDLEEEDFIHMGMSCAHTAFGIGVHFGCKPIILVGQDLSFGEDIKQTHASGTIYEDVKIEQGAPMDYEIEAYNGGTVKTTAIWLAFKNVFEKYIKELDVEVINATEGGVKILHSHQMTLEEVIEKYEGQPIDVYTTIKKCEYCKIKEEEIIERLERQKEYIENINTEIKRIIKDLRSIKIHRKNGGNLEKIRKKLLKTDVILNEVNTHWLFTHLYQSHIVNQIWRYYQLEQKITESTIKNNIKIQEELLEPILFSNNKVIEYIRNSKENMGGEMKYRKNE